MIQSSVEASGGLPSERLNPISSPMEQSTAIQELCISSIWSILLCFSLAKVLHHKPVKKESVVIMPAFGVQLETHYWSGRVIRRFVPISKILKPVLNECVTPVTCHWSLALILRDEDELMLVFQKLQPPVRILVPVWKALCAASH
ncbi:hypothetical protein C4D60_Mb06t33290 [Musa balbisiana]|uniref:Phosphatidylinositol N-acetylglucosaminyltransferase subunit H conserved domain-containing protein n=1 Tax=Musa balbisiana TaxID=52838 RepID=A0A4S8ISI5_MUSBA|nr:hypothetical protein C4D60_Mb06t33290 [Musa balbisiana]